MNSKHAWLNVILHKTERANTELTGSKRTLSMLERRALLFANGTRTIDQIRELLNAPDSGELIYLLEKKGFLTQIKPKAPAQITAAVSVVDEFMVQLKPFIAPLAANSFISKLIAPALAPKPSKVISTNNITDITAKPIAASVSNAEPNIAPLVETKAPIEQPVAIQEYSVNEQTKAAIKRIITNTCSEHLGIFSRELLDKTQQAQDDKQLRACISQWHMAMQESKTGREFCFDWLNDVNELLKHGAAQELKSA